MGEELEPSAEPHGSPTRLGLRESEPATYVQDLTAAYGEVPKRDEAIGFIDAAQKRLDELRAADQSLSRVNHDRSTTDIQQLISMARVSRSEAVADGVAAAAGLPTSSENTEQVIISAGEGHAAQDDGAIENDEGEEKRQREEIDALQRAVNASRKIVTS